MSLNNSTARLNEPLHSFLNDTEAWQSVVDTFRLTKRQSQIVRLILSGKQNRQIASELEIGIPTIQTQLERVYRRNGLNDRVDLILNIFAHAWELNCHRSQ